MDSHVSYVIINEKIRIGILKNDKMEFRKSEYLHKDSS